MQLKDIKNKKEIRSIQICEIKKRPHDLKHNVWVHIDHLLHKHQSANIHTSHINIGVANTFGEAVKIKNNFFNSNKVKPIIKETIT